MQKFPIVKEKSNFTEQKTFKIIYNMFTFITQQARVKYVKHIYKL